MHTDETYTNQPASSPAGDTDTVPLAALASVAILAAAGTLLAYSLLPRRKRPPIPGQLGLGLIAACAAAVIWNQRQEEADAARHLMSHIHEVRVTRWLKKHPIAYG
jgi:4-hydroxybenzoate polyprenyltransferase